jgi:hypothetical protein
VKNTFLEAVKLDERRTVVTDGLRHRLGAAAARRYSKRLVDAKPRTLATILRLVVTTTDRAELASRLDRLLPEPEGDAPPARPARSRRGR